MLNIYTRIFVQQNNKIKEISLRQGECAAETLFIPAFPAFPNELFYNVIAKETPRKILNGITCNLFL